VEGLVQRNGFCGKTVEPQERLKDLGRRYDLEKFGHDFPQQFAKYGATELA
jgi:hypothetical protein